ncbi:MAG: YceI family protein [Gemmataceae bacterium]|nr:YceI family protein [Gemmataceae bacterium]
MRRALFVAGLVALAAAQAVAADTYPLTGDNTKITFVGSKKNGKHEGGFKKLTGTVTVDGDPSTAKIAVDIDTASLWSDDPKLTGHLKSPDFFAVKDHPKATFKSTKVEKTDKGYTITGDLTLLGKTKPVTLPAKVAVAGDALTLTGETKINKSDWGMNYGKEKGMIDDDVALKVEVKAKKQ